MEKYCRRLEKYERRLGKYCRRLKKYCRHLKKYERRFGSMTLIKATATCLIEMQGYATFSAGFTQSVHQTIS
ncbi:MAG: hypothetical protein K6D37_04735 [Prevotella sp.]|nr:hypothetical protein [Prevotella sp.]